MPTDGEVTVDLLAKSLSVQKIELDNATRSAFTAYADMLIDWNTNRFNLTRLVTPEQIALNHFLDSIAVTQSIKIPYKATLIDVGTGAGFPGLALKIYRPDLKLVLVESTAKKLSFCKAVSEKLKLEKIEFLHGRAEDSSVQKAVGGAGVVVTARAVAPLKSLLNWVAPLISANGTFIAWKGSRVYDEVNEAQRTARYLGLEMEVKEQTISVPGALPVTHYFVACRHER